VYSNAFQRKTHDCAYDNFKGCLFMIKCKYLTSAFSEGLLQNVKEPAAEGYIQMEHSSD
jgi:hypothetical protein